MARQPVSDPARDEALLIAAFAGALAVVAAGAWVSLRVAAWWDHTTAPPAAPADLVRALASHRVRWDTTATVVAALLGLLTVLAVLGVVVLLSRGRPSRERCDRATRHLAPRGDLARLAAGARRGKNRDLHLADPEDGPGLPLGDALLAPYGRARRAVYASWEDMTVLVAGPRTNKTTAYAIPMLLSAPGAALLTSNKRDALDATRALRATAGRRVWVFDPQQVAAEPATWWWDPITYVAGPNGPDPARALKLAAQFTASTTPNGARVDGYFDTEKTNLIALLLLAAATGRQPLPVVWEWLCDPDDTTPAATLAEAGFDRHARALHALSSLPDKQRDGVYGSARAVMGFLLDPAVNAWITPTGDTSKQRLAFGPNGFARSTDTLYLLSREGIDGAGALVAALVLAVTDALVSHATTSPAGRLPVPFVGVLDEAANICRLRDLDSLYSHYGSRGICLVTVLQSWAQGADVWGPSGMEKLWSAANVRVYGGGVDDHQFCRRLSELIGTHNHAQQTRTSTRDGTTRTRSHIERTTLTAAELRELPPGRAVCFASGTPAFLLAPRPWWTGPHATAIRTALDEHRHAIPQPRSAATAEQRSYATTQDQGLW
jgi:type IV secretory pathway TraG/TraD family ATPase VirD4